jgi:hypothetical protein
LINLSKPQRPRGAGRRDEDEEVSVDGLDSSSFIIMNGTSLPPPDASNEQNDNSLHQSEVESMELLTTVASEKSLSDVGSEPEIPVILCIEPFYLHYCLSCRQ